MYMTGFADEAGHSLDVQIRATRELGWTHIEARGLQVDDFPLGNLHDIPEAAFDLAQAKLEKAGIRVNCFGSAIGNWAKKIDEPFESSLAEARRAIPRMQRLGTTLIRIMSFAVHDAEDQMEQERFRRLRELLKLFSDAGLTPVHENCMNYGGMGWPFTLKLLENVPGLKLVFDTGNAVLSFDRSKPKPWPMQNSWEFYSHIKEHVAYIHIKDGYRNLETNKDVCTYPGEGRADVRKIVKDLLLRGYDDGISIEPHMGAVFHDPSSGHSLNAEAIYIEYGRRMEKLIAEVRAEMRKEQDDKPARGAGR
ncbi:MAG: sugar phosphate isomerase/epimerase [Lentisphaerae bacterium]|nr:sugar phosphate isomerase/epimerase [Lentisphaerota bacterium]